MNYSDDPNNPYKRIFSYSFHFPNHGFSLPKQKTAEQLIAELDLVDEVVDAMETYPTAERMLAALLESK